jgi:hypothetical protein
MAAACASAALKVTLISQNDQFFLGMIIDQGGKRIDGQWQL